MDMYVCMYFGGYMDVCWVSFGGSSLARWDIGSEVPCFEREDDIFLVVLDPARVDRIEITMLSCKQKIVSRVAVERELG